MSTYNRAQTIDFYLNQILVKKIEFSSLREILEKKKLEKKEIDIEFRQIDKELIKADKLKASAAIGRNLFYGGIILSLAGAILTIGTITGLIDFDGYAIIAYGPIFGGLLIALTGKQKMNRF